MASFRDLTNMQFGRLRATEYCGTDANKKSLWKCLCECGKTKIVTAQDLLRGDTKSCGCLHKELSHSRISVVGTRFGRLVVTSDAPDRNGRRYENCQCDCGKQVCVAFASLRRGLTQSCGCLQLERNSETHKTHGCSKDRRLRILYGMNSRCSNPKHPRYKDYGGRGVKVDHSWNLKTNPERAAENWLKFCDESGYVDGLTIERKNVNGDYCPENCTWVTGEEQARNTRANVKYEGLTQEEWSRKLGVNHSSIWNMRKRNNWSLGDAVRYYLDKGKNIASRNP